MKNSVIKENDAKNGSHSAEVQSSSKCHNQLTLLLEQKAKYTISDTELALKLQHSYAQSIAGDGRPMNTVIDGLERSIK